MTDAVSPVFCQLNLVVSDMPAALAFYRRLGLQVEWHPDSPHARAVTPSGFRIEWDTAEFAVLYDSGSRGATGGGMVLGFSVASRAEVDGLYADLTAAGYHGRQRPYDAAWGSRFAIVDDPDGNGVGLMSPQEDEHKYWPPRQAPGRTGAAD